MCVLGIGTSTTQTQGIPLTVEAGAMLEKMAFGTGPITPQMWNGKIHPSGTVQRNEGFANGNILEGAYLVMRLAPQVNGETRGLEVTGTNKLFTTGDTVRTSLRHGRARPRVAAGIATPGPAQGLYLGWAIGSDGNQPVEGHTR